jgi:hypothetical protein
MNVSLPGVRLLAYKTRVRSILEPTLSLILLFGSKQSLSTEENREKLTERIEPDNV